MQSGFFALMSRMKYIRRWGLMRSTTEENIAEHSLQVAWVAHALAIIENKFFGGDYDACRIGMIGAYHETGEIITGDLPTPIKYFTPEISAAYKKVEKIAEKRIIATLPSELRDEFAPLIQPTEKEKKLIKYADKITAFIKCVEELCSNNNEFKSAHDSLEKEIRSYACPAVDYFMDNFIGAYRLTLDELSNGKKGE